MKSFKRFIEESVHDELEKKGMKKTPGRSEKFPMHSGKVSKDSLHKILTNNGWRMNTHTKQGRPMEPKTSYSTTKGPDAHAEIQDAQGKTFVIFNYAQSHD